MGKSSDWFKKNMKVVAIFVVICVALAAIPNPFESSGRYWWVGGSFSSVTYINSTTNQNVTIPAGNFAQWDGYSWEGTTAMGSGTNGPVFKTVGDQCSNIYLGGQFTTVKGDITGPAAVWRPKSKIFQRIGDAGQITWSSGAIVRAITIDCANIPDGSLECPCDVFLGGDFTATITATGATARNLVKYSFSEKKWDDLRTNSYLTGPVFALHKKAFGVTKATNYLYVGGASNLQTKGGFAKYNVKTNTWGYDDSTKEGTVAGTVYGFYYYTPTIDTDQLFVAGDFTWTAGGVTAKNIAQFDWSAETIKTVGTTNMPTERINTIGYGNKHLFVGGQGPVAGDVSYIRKISFDGAAGTTWGKISTAKNDVTEISQPVFDMWVCDTTDCATNSNTGSVAFVGSNNAVRFYVRKTDSFVNFGLGTSGQANTITSAFLLNAAGTSVISCALMILAALVAFLF